ncbi:DUF1007 family protein [Roseobacteraceae bacterium NS-SX3]
MTGFRSLLALAALAALVPAVAGAHPHVFVDTGLKLEVSRDGRLEAVEVTWVYDEFYSLLLFEDLGLDPDADGVLTAEELARLQGFDMRWEAGFVGDTYVTQAGEAVALGAPEPLETRVEDGRIITRHRRAATGRPQADGLEVRAYDPGYYTAYTLTHGAEVTGGGCTASVTPPDLDRAYSLAEELLYAMPAAQAEESYPEVGEAFAGTVRLSCGA